MLKVGSLLSFHFMFNASEAALGRSLFSIFHTYKSEQGIWDHIHYCSSLLQDFCGFNMKSSTSQQNCWACHKLQSDLPTSLKRYATCPDTLYCSREYQKEDWKNHKRVCASRTECQAGSSRQTHIVPYNLISTLQADS